ncbi:MAG: DUF3108 domain-containing protein [Elusimicrobiota bacterium]|jgi:hypothetical protein|nr:DUF3108 domain-containing protein [Elusimicrobiota bacterium]
MQKYLAALLFALFVLGCAAKPWHRQAVVTAPPAPQEEAPSAPTGEQAAQTPASDDRSGGSKAGESPKQAPVITAETTAQEEPLLYSQDGRLTHPWYAAPDITAGYAGVKPNWFGESLKFKVGWSFITAGEAEIKTDKIVQTEEGPAFAVETYAQSYSVIDRVFKVRDINVSWVSGALDRSLGYWQSVREGRYKRDEWLKFNYKTHDFLVHKLNNKGNLESYGGRFTGDKIWDMLSALYYVRNEPLPLKGEVYFDIVNTSKQYPLKVIVHGKESIKVKAGKFDCILVEPFIAGEGIFVSKGKSLKVWLTDDEYKMPVKMTAEVFIGSVHAELTEYKRG